MFKLPAQTTLDSKRIDQRNHLKDIEDVSASDITILLGVNAPKAFL